MPAGRSWGGGARRAAVVASALLLWVASAAAWQQAGGPAAQQVAARHLQRGIELLARGDAAAAVRELEAAVALAPLDPRARYHLGRALFAAGRPGDAVAHLQEALDRAADPGPVHFLLAQVWLELEELGPAAEALEAAAAARPGYPPIGLYRAELCYRLGRVEEALERLEALAAAAPRWEAPRVRAGTICLELGRAEAAVAWFRAALEITPEDPALWMRLASALAALRRPREAAEAYRRAVEAAPDLLPPRMALAAQLDHLRDHQAMRQVLEEILQRAPGNPLGLYHRALLRSMEGDHRGALADVELALRGFRRQEAGLAGALVDRHTYRALAQGLQAQLLAKLGRHREAEAVARALVASDPWHPEAHFVLGTLLLRRGDPEGRRHLERFKALSDAREHRELGDYYGTQVGDLERARGAYEAALAANPDDAPSLLGLARIERLRGAADRALELLGRARPGPADAAGWYRERVLALHAAGRLQEARAVWREARASGLRLGPQVWRLMRDGRIGC